MNEIWKPIPSLPAYEASSLGRVRCKPFHGKMPHGGVRLYGGGPPTLGVWHKEDQRFILRYRGKNHKVARLVCEAFNGPPDSGAVCMHLNENSADNRPENLAWGTQRENMNAPGFIAMCKSSVSRAWNGNVISDEKVREIRSRRNEPRAAIAREYGISASQVCHILSGRARKAAGGL